ncbi:hypothetical protein D3C80_2069480 [compost metagenome]
MPENTRMESPSLPRAITVSPSSTRRRWSTSRLASFKGISRMSKPNCLFSLREARRWGCSFTGKRTSSSISR